MTKKSFAKHLCFLVVAICTLDTSVAQPINKQDGGKNPGSLWSDSYVNPLVDRVARKEGDVLTIIISESSAATYEANTKASKNDQTVIDKAMGPIIRYFIRGATDGASSQVDGKGTTNQNGRMSARISAIVMKVLPNGNLIIEGSKSMTINKEIQNFRITGIVRRDDILSDNTVRSEDIAEAIIAMNGKGMIADRQRRGILTRLLDWLF